MYLYLYSYRRETARQLRMYAQLTRCFSAVAELLVNTRRPPHGPSRRDVAYQRYVDYICLNFAATAAAVTIGHQPHRSHRYVLFSESKQVCSVIVSFAWRMKTINKEWTGAKMSDDKEKQKAQHCWDSQSYCVRLQSWKLHRRVPIGRQFL